MKSSRSISPGSKANALLIVDRNRVLALSIIPERVQSISWRHLEVVQLRGKVDVLELTDCSFPDVGRKPLRCASREELFRPAVGEGFDHRAP